jgi:hypothetical protein
MSALHRGASAAGFQAARAPHPFSIFATFLAVLLLAGCAATPREIISGPDPSDPGVPVASVTYRPATGTYERLRPAAPAAWRQQNERAAPQQKPDGGGSQ